MAALGLVEEPLDRGQALGGLADEEVSHAAHRLRLRPGRAARLEDQRSHLAHGPLHPDEDARLRAMLCPM